MSQKNKLILIFTLLLVSQFHGWAAPQPPPPAAPPGFPIPGIIYMLGAALVYGVFYLKSKSKD